MAKSKSQIPADEMDYPAHEHTYVDFTKLLKYGTIVAGLVTALVVYVISN